MVAGCRISFLFKALRPSAARVGPGQFSHSSVRGRWCRFQPLADVSHMGSHVQGLDPWVTWSSRVFEDMPGVGSLGHVVVPHCSPQLLCRRAPTQRASGPLPGSRCAGGSMSLWFGCWCQVCFHVLIGCACVTVGDVSSGPLPTVSFLFFSFFPPTVSYQVVLLTSVPDVRQVLTPFGCAICSTFSRHAGCLSFHSVVSRDTQKFLSLLWPSRFLMFTDKRGFAGS